MLTFFRNIFKTKLGLVLTLAFLALVALAFASADVANTPGGQGISAGDNAAVVGDYEITATMLARAATSALDRARQQDPTMSMPAFVAQGGLEATLDQLIDRAAVSEYARKHGLRAGDNLVNSEIRNIGAFRGPDGNFSADVYRQALASQGLSDAVVREDLKSGLLAQQLFGAAAVGVRYPRSVSDRYAQLFKERRNGAVATLPSAAFAPTGDPSQAALTQFYKGSQARFIRPERRVLRYAVFGPEEVSDRVVPSAAEVAARYKENASQYRAREERSFTQLIVPTRQAAEAIAKQVAGGGSLEAAARSAGLRTSSLPSADRATLASSSSDAVAQAYFSAAQNSLTAPARSPLGWQIARVDAINRVPGQTLASATPAITKALTAEKRVQALSDLAGKVEEDLDGGATLGEITSQLKISPTTTGPLTATGNAYGSGEGAGDDLRPALTTAFQMDESTPQVAQIPDSERFIIFEVARITPSAVAPLAEIRSDVIAAWRVAEGAKGARAAADRVLARIRKGATLASALAAETAQLPAPQPVAMSREELAQQQQRVPPPLALMFSMAQGTVKKLEMPGSAGWFIVDLDKIDLGKLAANDPLAVQAQQELERSFGQELTEQAVAAMREAVGVARNPEAVNAVRNQLTGNR